jgi:hypothetical protein
LQSSCACAREAASRIFRGDSCCITGRHGGTGHYSLARGLVGAVQGIGGSSSQAVAGYIVTTAGYNAAFLILAMVATAGLLLIVIAMPETTPSQKGGPS